MGLRVIGAGLPRTGTTSLKSALERLLGEPCYHMIEVFGQEDHGRLWHEAAQGDAEAWRAALQGYGAAVDWPASLFWRELHDENPDALVLLSHRGDAETWWRSVDRTVWAAMRKSDLDPTIATFHQALRTKAGMGQDWDDQAVAMALYDDLYDEVVATVPAERLVIWEADQGWSPLCEALDLPVPEVEFFHKNTTDEFRQHSGLDAD